MEDWCCSWWATGWLCGKSRVWPWARPPAKSPLTKNSPLPRSPGLYRVRGAPPEIAAYLALDRFTILGAKQLWRSRVGHGGPAGWRARDERGWGPCPLG